MTATFSVKQVFGGYVVVDQTGQPVCTPQADYAAIAVACDARQRAADRRARLRQRPCMCCRQPFLSEGIHNRLCKTCATNPPSADFADGGHSVPLKRKR